MLIEVTKVPQKIDGVLTNDTEEIMLVNTDYIFSVRVMDNITTIFYEDDGEIPVKESLKTILERSRGIL